MSKKHQLSRAKRRAQQRNAPVKADRPVSVTTVEHSISFSGPLPPPQILGLYDQVVPGMAERLMTAFEQQQTHRHKLEAEALSHGIRRSWCGQWLGFALCIAGFIVTGIGFTTQQGGSAAVVGSGTLVGLAVVFVTGQQSQRREREGRREALVKKQ